LVIISARKAYEGGGGEVAHEHSKKSQPVPLHN
jgi:hypothetical protein